MAIRQVGTEGAERGADTPPAHRVLPHGMVLALQRGKSPAVQGCDAGGVDAAVFREVAQVKECVCGDRAQILWVVAGADGSEEAAHGRLAPPVLVVYG